MKENTNECRFWRKPALFNIDFASYRLNAHEFSKHFHDHFVIEWVAAGVDRFYCAGKTFTAETGQLVFINPGEVHTGSTVAGMDLRYFSLCPDLSALQKIAAWLEMSIPSAFEFNQTLLDDPRLANRITLLCNALFNAPADEFLQEEHFVSLMQHLLGGITVTDTRNKQDDGRMAMLQHYIQACCCEPLTLSHFSRLIHLNPFHLMRLFKQFSGMSPYEYLINARIEKAKGLLKNGMSVQCAAAETGFCDDAHFSRHFTKRVGLRPGAYSGGEGVAVNWD